MPHQAGGPRAAVILGNDAVVAARPSSLSELVRACRAAGFDIVVPPSWGDELVADGYLARLTDRRDGVVVACACPRVRTLVAGAATGAEATCITLAAPPVAAARYLRLVYGDTLLVTYVGDCPSASDGSIDARFTPGGFFASLHRQGVTLSDVATAADMDDSELDRWRRHRSIPGGLPARRFLARAPVDRVLREADVETVAAAAWKTSRWRVLLDLSDAAGCACGGDRAQVEDAEPARSPTPILVEPPGLSLLPGSAAVRAQGSSASAANTPDAPAAVARASIVDPPVATNLAREPQQSPPPVVQTPRRQTPTARTVSEPRPPAAASGRSTAMLVAIPGVVLTLTAALGMAAYMATTAAAPTGTARARSTLTGETAAHDSAMRSPATRSDSAASSPTQQPPVTPQPDTSALNPRATPPGAVRATTPLRPRVRRAPELVPGWLPQGQKAWTPADTLPPRRPDSLRAAPAKPDTIPRA